MVEYQKLYKSRTTPDPSPNIIRKLLKMEWSNEKSWKNVIPRKYFVIVAYVSYFFILKYRCFL